MAEGIVIVGDWDVVAHGPTSQLRELWNHTKLNANMGSHSSSSWSNQLEFCAGFCIVTFACTRL